MATTAQTYEALIKRVREIKTLESVAGFLGWDQEVFMPPKGGKARAEALALLSSLTHGKLTDPEMGRILKDLKDAELDGIQGVNVREVFREYDKATKLPPELVEEMARTRSLAQQVWQEARAKRDFGHFQKMLTKMVGLTKQTAEHYGYQKEPYDALLDIYEPGMTAVQLEPMFAGLRKEIVPLVKAISESGREAPVMPGPFDLKAQEALGRYLTKAIGFDMDAGRLDASAHPFTSGLNPGDVRFTTRYNDDEPFMALYATLHEAGHGMYEQGLLEEHFTTPMGTAVSLGIHESQSRTWENMVGRSRPFCDFVTPELLRQFPHLGSKFNAETLYRIANRVKPSFIRVEADEVTYNLHILLRFEMERELINGELELGDLPRLWDDKMKDYLGVTPPDVAVGVLQDIHWSMGYIGYFPTYTLGNLYGAQFMTTARKTLPDLDQQVSKGEFAPLLEWQRENIHRHGMCYGATELVEKVSGQPASSEAFLKYLKGKYEPLYGI